MKRIKFLSWSMGMLMFIVAFIAVPLLTFAADPAIPSVAASDLGAWASANWGTIVAVLIAALSEIIGMSPLKSNSLVQLILSILGKVFVRKAVALIIIGSFLLAACGGTVVLKSAQVTKATAEAALTEAVAMKQSGTITPDQFAEVKKAYDALKVAQGVLIDARIAYLKSPTQDIQAAVDAAVSALAAASGKLVDIARTYKIGEGLLW